MSTFLHLKKKLESVKLEKFLEKIEEENKSQDDLGDYLWSLIA